MENLELRVDRIGATVEQHEKHKTRSDETVVICVELLEIRVD